MMREWPYTVSSRDLLYTYTAERRDVQPNTSRFEAVYGHSLIIDPSLGMYQEIHPCRASRTYSDKINTSLPMMREWNMFVFSVFWMLANRTLLCPRIEYPSLDGCECFSFNLFLLAGIKHHHP